MGNCADHARQGHHQLAGLIGPRFARSRPGGSRTEPRAQTRRAADRRRMHRPALRTASAAAIRHRSRVRARHPAGSAAVLPRPVPPGPRARPGRLTIVTPHGSPCRAGFDRGAARPAAAVWARAARRLEDVRDHGVCSCGRVRCDEPSSVFWWAIMASCSRSRGPWITGMTGMPARLRRLPSGR